MGISNRFPFSNLVTVTMPIFSNFVPPDTRHVGSRDGKAHVRTIKDGYPRLLLPDEVPELLPLVLPERPPDQLLEPRISKKSVEVAGAR